MALEFLIWLLALLMQSALLGMTMYTLICLTDLENDFLNPHDATARINNWVVPEIVVQCLLVVILLVGRKWVAVVLPCALALWCFQCLSKGTAYTDVTEIFRQCPREKKKRYIRLGLQLLMFILTVFWLVKSAVHGILSDEGRDVAKRLLQDTVAFHY